MLTGYGHIAQCDFRTEELLYPSFSGSTARRINFYKRGTVDAPYYMLLDDVTWNGEVGDDEWFGIKQTTVDIGIVLESFHMAVFFAADDRDIFVELQSGPISLFNSTPSGEWKTVFMGWLNPFSAKEDYVQLTSVAHMSAKCGLESLKDFAFYKYPLNRQVSGTATLKDIFYGALLWAGPDRPLWISMQTWNKAQTSVTTGLGTTEDSLSWSKLQLQNFKEQNKWKSCYDVLDELLKGLNARLLHDQGVWKIIRIDEEPLRGVNRNWVVFDSSTDTTPGFFQEQPRLIIGPSFMPDDAASLSYEAGTPYQKVTFKYGELYNILTNGDFADGLTSWTAPNLSKWYPTPYFDQTPASFTTVAVGNGETETPFGLKITGNSPLDENIALAPTKWQVISVTRTGKDSPNLANVNLPGFNKTIADPHLLSLSFEYLNINCGGPKVRVWVLVTDRYGKELVYNLDSAGKWDRHLRFFMPRNVYKDGDLERAKPTVGEKFEIKSEDPVPGVGNYTIYVELHAGTPISGAVDGLAPSTTYRNMIMTRDIATAVLLDSDAVTAQAYDFDPAKRPHKEETELIIGSQVSAKGGSLLRMGAILNNDGTTPAQDWAVLMPDGSVKIASFQELCALGRLRLSYRHAQTFEGDLNTAPGPLFIPVLEELGYKGFPLSYKWKERERTCSIKAIELLPVSAQNPTIKRVFITPDGAELPMSGTGEVLPQGAEPNGLTGLDALKKILGRDNPIPMNGIIGPLGFTAAQASVFARTKAGGGIILNRTRG